MDEFSITIPLRYLGNVHARVAAINAKLAKRGATPFELSIGKERIVSIAPRDDRETVDIPAVDIRIVGTPYKVPGHRLVGVFYRGDGEVPNRLVGYGGHRFSEEQQQCGEQCDHCNTKRRRNTIFFLHEDSTGRVLQIGGDCAEEYLGVTPARAVNTIHLYDEAASILREMENEFLVEDELLSDGSVVAKVELTEYLAAVCSAVRQYGWISRTTAENTGAASTADTALEIRSAQVTSADTMQAMKILEYWRGRYPLNIPQSLDTFEANIKLLVHASHVAYRSLGTAAWLADGYSRAMQDLKARQMSAESQHVGQIGDKIDAVVEVSHIGSYETQFGIRYIFSLISEEGNQFVWKTTSPPPVDVLRQGQCWAIKASIKGHGEYRGVKQTEVVRVRPELQFATFPSGEADIAFARAELFLKCLGDGWVNKRLAKSIGDVSALINSATPNPLERLVTLWIADSGSLRSHYGEQIKELMRMGADPTALRERKLGEVELMDAIARHSELEQLITTRTKRRSTVSQTPTM